jgi:hypothetical protein
MRSPVKVCSYTATVGESVVNKEEVSLTFQAMAGHTGHNEPLLAGPEPTIRFLGDRMVLIPAPRGTSHLKWCSFLVGDVVVRAVRAGDRIDVHRDVNDGVAVCMFRGEKLLLAVGALLGPALGPDVTIRSAGLKYRQLRFDIRVGTEQGNLGARESAVLGGYDIYVEFAEFSNDWAEGNSESISVASVDDPAIVNSARRTAVLMARDDSGALCGEASDGTMIKSRYHIG